MSKTVSKTVSKKAKFMDGFISIAAKIGGQRHLSSIRDGFVSLMPLIIIGSLGTLFKNFPINNWANILPGFIANILGAVWWGTLGVLSIYAVFAIAYHLAKSYEGNALAAGLVAVASYIALVPQSVVSPSGEGMWGAINWSYLSANSLFLAIIIALISTEIFVRLNRVKFLQIKLPSSVPPAVGRSFSALIPASLTILIIALIGEAPQLIAQKNLFQLVDLLFKPLIHAADSLVSGILLVLLNQVLWIFGLHGSNIIGGIWEPLSANLMSANIAAFESGAAIPHIMTKPFLDCFVHLGGAGATLGLIAAIFIVSRSKLMRTMGKTCIGPGVFNINEPALYGLPVVLNPIFAIPFIVGPVLITIISYAATYFGLVARTVAVVPWATPPIISGWMVTGGDWKACVLQVINIAVVILLYIPFVKMADKIEMKKEAAIADKAAKTEV